MAAHESIHEYYLHQHRSIEYFLELCLSHADPDLVHELRLSIKKLRAFHKLAECLFLNDIDEHIHIKNRVRQLYKAAGQLRDTQVQIDLLGTFEQKTGIQYPEFGKWLLKREKKRILRFKKKPQHVVPHAIAQSTHQKIGDLLALADDETILKGAGKVLNDLCSKAQILSTGNMNERNLHSVRTITKQMRYILNVILHSYPDFKFSEVTANSLREIEAAAGQWHDNLVRIELMEKFTEEIKFADDSEMFKYQKMQKACKSELDYSFNEATLIVRKSLCSKGENPELA